MEPRTLRLHCVVIKILLFALLLPPSVTLVPEPFAVLTPLHYVAYLGEPAVRFNCSAANASNISWHINGSSEGRNFIDQTMGIIAQMDLNLLESTLTIPSTFITNNTRIQCIVRHLYDRNFTLTDEAILQVQGILEKCSHLQFVFHDAYHLNLTWNPPPTLNITAVEPDIAGYVVCDDIRTTCTHIDMRESGGDSHNLPEYIFPNLRVNITFTVRAVNIVGDGESTNVTYPSCLNISTIGTTERFGAQDLSAEVSYDFEGAPTLSLTAMSQRSCFDVYLVHIEPLELDADSEGSRLNELIKSEPIIPSVNDSGDGKGRLTLNVTTNSSLDTNMFYNATLTTIPDRVEAGSIRFSTYDVQDAVIHVGAENISIQCIFARGSYARGCHVKIGNTTIQIIKPRNATQTENKLVTGLTPGSYEVLIFDWEKNGSIATTSSHLEHVHVTEPATSFEPTTFHTPTSFSTPSILSRPTNFSMPTSVSTTTAPGTPYISIGQTQPTSLPVEYIAAIGSGVLVILVLLVLVVVMFVIVFKCQRREPMPKELEKDLVKGLKWNVYELSPTTALPIVGLDSKTPPLDGSPTDPHYDIITSIPVPPTSPTFSAVDGSPTNPLYDVISSLPIPPTSPTSSMTKRGSGLSQSPAGVTQARHTSRHTCTQLIDTSSHIYTPVNKKKFQDTSSHIYTKPVTEKSSVWKPVAASSTDRTATDGDSDRGTTPPDHHSSEGSDLTPPLPPRNYNNSEFDIPPLQLCASISADKLAGSKPTHQCTSCTILPRPSIGSTTDVQSCTLPQSAGRSYFSLQHLPGISVFPVSSNQYQYSQKQDSTSDIADQSRQTVTCTGNC